MFAYLSLSWMFSSVFKFVEHPENNEKPMNQKSGVKFKIMSLKVNEPMDYIPEMVRLVSSLLTLSCLFCYIMYLRIKI